MIYVMCGLFMIVFAIMIGIGGIALVIKGIKRLIGKDD